MEGQCLQGTMSGPHHAREMMAIVCSPSPSVAGVACTCPNPACFPRPIVNGKAVIGPSRAGRAEARRLGPLKRSSILCRALSSELRGRAVLLPDAPQRAPARDALAGRYLLDRISVDPGTRRTGPELPHAGPLLLARSPPTSGSNQARGSWLTLGADLSDDSVDGPAA